MTINVQDYTELDNLLQSLAKSVDILDYVTPLNSSSEKTKFFSDKSYTPTFEYKELDYDKIADLVEQLNSIKIPETVLGEIYAKKRDETLLIVEMMKNIGDSDFIRDASSELYGTPSKELVERAETLFLKIKPVELIKDVPAEDIKIILENALRDNNINDWTVEYGDKKLTNVYPAEKKITLYKDRKFLQNAKSRLGVHEVGVHTLRCANGYEQPLNIFATGLPKYISTEEGLALYFEDKTGTINNQTMRNYAGRVIAVDSVVNGLEFKECFDTLVDSEFTEDDAWNLTVRAYRGGGFIKDHVYLEGYYKVKEFAEAGGNIKNLYVGKVGIEDLPLVAELLDSKILKKPEHLPSFLQESV